MDPALLNLRDIHLPEAVSWWPPALGWWFLGFLLLLFSVYQAGRFWHALPRRRAVHEARVEFERIRLRYRAERDGVRLLAELSVLLRRVAVTIGPRTQVAGLTGRAWLEELDRGLGGNGFRQGPGRLLADAPYQPQVPVRNVEMLLELCEQWLRVQRKYSRARSP